MNDNLRVINCEENCKSLQMLSFIRLQYQTLKGKKSSYKKNIKIKWVFWGDKRLQLHSNCLNEMLQSEYEKAHFYVRFHQITVTRGFHCSRHVKSGLLVHHLGASRTQWQPFVISTRRWNYGFCCVNLKVFPTPFYRQLWPHLLHIFCVAWHPEPPNLELVLHSVFPSIWRQKPAVYSAAVIKKQGEAETSLDSWDWWTRGPLRKLCSGINIKQMQRLMSENPAGSLKC